MDSFNCQVMRLCLRETNDVESFNDEDKLSLVKSYLTSNYSSTNFYKFLESKSWFILDIVKNVIKNIENSKEIVDKILLEFYNYKVDFFEDSIEEFNEKLTKNNGDITINKERFYASK